MKRKRSATDNNSVSAPALRKITVRPTEGELKILHLRAESFGYKSLSKYLIERGMREGQMIESTERERIERLLFEVRKVGVNVNQIARQMHKGYSEYSQAYIDRAMRQVERVVSEIAGEVSGGDKETDR